MMRALHPVFQAATIALLLCFAGCASAPKSIPSAAPEVPAAPTLDASYDWHGLLLLPFGSVLKDVPFTLHEVLMFRDAAHAAQGDDAECYAMERAAPRFLKRTPDEYLLCFKHDHLARVEATVNLPADEAARIFSDACGLWERNAGPAPSAAPAGAVASGEGAGAQIAANAAPASAMPVGTGACEGRDGAVGYSSRLEESTDATGSALIMHLDSLAQP